MSKEYIIDSLCLVFYIILLNMYQHHPLPVFLVGAIFTTWFWFSWMPYSWNKMLDSHNADMKKMLDDHNKVIEEIEELYKSYTREVTND